MILSNYIEWYFIALDKLNESNKASTSQNSKSVSKLIALERRYSKLDDARFPLPLAHRSLHLIYLPVAATRIPITNFPYDIAFRALCHHWKVLFSQELTSFSKNRAELRCRTSRLARDAVVVNAAGCMQFCKLELNLPRREREQIRSSRGKCLTMAPGK